MEDVVHSARVNTMHTHTHTHTQFIRWYKTWWVGRHYCQLILLNSSQMLERQDRRTITLLDVVRICDKASNDLKSKHGQRNASPLSRRQCHNCRVCLLVCVCVCFQPVSKFCNLCLYMCMHVHLVSWSHINNFYFKLCCHVIVNALKRM